MDYMAVDNFFTENVFSTALLAAGLYVLGAVCRPIQLHLEKRAVLLPVLLELLATASLPKGLVSLAATVLANTQYSEVSTGQ
eukprot:s5126_g2.t1